MIRRKRQRQGQKPRQAPLPGVGLPELTPSSELDAALQAVALGGEVTLRHLGNAAFELKRDHSLVTAADREVEAVVRAVLERLTPGIKVLGEESATGQAVKDLAALDAWVVDPIDGTASFAAGLPTFAISIGLLRKGEPVLGVLYLPRTDELYGVDTSGPAFYGGRLLPKACLVPETVDERAFFCVPSDAHHDFDFRFPGKMRSLGSTALHVALVARGAALAAVLRPQVWDVAAVAAILRRAGGDLFDFATGAPLDFPAWTRGESVPRNLIACSPACLPVLRPCIVAR